MKTRNEKARAVRKVKKELAAEWARIGGLSAPSKMPGFSIGLPATACKTGAKLAKVAGSTCSNCYALKGNYRYDNVTTAQKNRLTAIDSPTWVADMTSIIGAACAELEEPFFRWHDSGDIQNVRHFLNIVQVCNNLSHISFWLPTKEYRLVLGMAKHIKLPPNLTVRVSAPKLNATMSIDGVTTSNVSTRKMWVSKKTMPLPNSFLCRAYSQNGECRDCRLCWSPNVSAVTYPKH